MSHKINIFDLILFWPFEISEEQSKDGVGREAIKQQLTAQSAWQESLDPLRRGCTDQDDGFAYAEWCEFHPSVRRFLYGDSAGSAERGPERPFDLYRSARSNNQKLRIEESDCQIEFAIRDLRLYVADNGLAFVTLDLTATAPTTWRFALNALSKFRAIYPQYYEAVEEDDRVKGWRVGGAYERIRIEPEEAETPFEKLHPSAEGRGAELKKALDDRQPPILGHWRRLLHPLLDLEIGPHLLSDHRMSAMVWMGVEEIHKLSNDDWMALAEADEFGFSPYSEAFLSEALHETAYDRWWDQRKAEDLKQDHRYVVGEKVLASVKGLPPGAVPPYVERIRKSWRRQYAQMYFVAQFQRASLLALQDRVADATPQIRLDGSGVVCRDERKLLERVEELQAAMAVFSSRYWFPEVSNQVQPQDLYAKVKKKLRLEELYSSVLEDKALLGAWVTAREERRRDKFWNRVNWFFIPMSLLLSFLGANLILEPAKSFVTTSRLGDILQWPARLFTHAMWVELATAGTLTLILLASYTAFHLLELFWRKFRDRRSL